MQAVVAMRETFRVADARLTNLSQALPEPASNGTARHVEFSEAEAGAQAQRDPATPFLWLLPGLLEHAGRDVPLRDLAGERPLIGIPLGRALPDAPKTFLVRSTYPAAVIAAGGFPVLLPPTSLRAVAPSLDQLDGLLFPGGDDVTPEIYGQDPHPTTASDPSRDPFELGLVAWSLRTRAPTLCICRGQQILNVALGGDLIQDLPSEGFPPHRQTGPRNAFHHRLALSEDSRLPALLGERELAVNSFHHQAVGRVAPGLRAVGWSEDGVVEALEALEALHPWLIAVQFHPEDLVFNHAPSRALFDFFVQAVASARDTRTLR